MGGIKKIKFFSTSKDHLLCALKTVKVVQKTPKKIHLSL